MTVLSTRPLPALDIDDFVANPKLAELIPVNLALRYRSLPIADSGGTVTGVMADPGNLAAQERIRGVIGRPMKVVRGDEAVIETLIAELWPGHSHACLHLAVLLIEHRDTSLVSFGRLLGEWLKADEAADH